jgi:hypothetical protein
VCEGWVQLEIECIEEPEKPSWYSNVWCASQMHHGETNLHARSFTVIHHDHRPPEHQRPAISLPIKLSCLNPRTRGT